MSGKVTITGLRHSGSILYRTFMKSSPRFVATVTIGAIALEASGGGFVDALWRLANKGKLWPDVRKQVLERQSGSNPLDTVVPSNNRTTGPTS